MTINNNNIFGAFTLNEARGSRLTGEWLNKESVANYGWFGGGFSGGQISTVDRIDFSNDSVSASPRGPLSLERYNLTATGNSNYGWFGGGTSVQSPFTSVSTVDRIDFSNDSSTASVRGPLSSTRYSLSATGNSNYGWFGGGGTFPGPSISTVDRIDFSNDSSTASVRGSLSLTRTKLTATGNSNYGWIGSGMVFPAIYSTVDRIDFSNDFASASVRGPLSLARSFLAATGNSNYGWFGGGQPDAISTVDRIDFSNDSVTASPRGQLSLARSGLAATGNSNYGWFGGGSTVPIPTVSTVERIDFSNDSVSTSFRGSLTPAPGRNSLSATSGVLNIRRQKAGNFGWFGGGVTPVDRVATVERIDFSNDSTTASRGSLFTERYYLTATGNSNYGWFGGGTTNFTAPVVVVATVDRIDFSNDSATASVRGPLSSVRTNLVATGNSNYGWFGGGKNPALPVVPVLTVDRIDFSNDSATALARGPLFAARYDLAATGNSNYGWFGNGFPAPGRLVDRIDFSNDSASASVRGLLSEARVQFTATGNSNYGWFGGGSPVTAKVDRIDFSNDSVSASVRGPLFQARRNLTATGNSNYGWFCGGIDATPANVATVDRIDFSNDSVSASIRGSLSDTKYGLAATSNTNK